MSAGLWFCVPVLLQLLGATGRAARLAEIYLYIILPTLPLLAVGMTSSAVLRSVGDARRAMYITLSGAAVNVLMDVVLILKLGWGIEGAAIASAVARLAVFAIGLYGVGRVHQLFSRVKPGLLGEDFAVVQIHCRPRRPDQPRHPLQQCRRHRRRRALRRCSGCRLGSDRAHHAGGVRCDLRALWNGRTHHRPELRRPEPGAHAGDADAVALCHGGVYRFRLVRPRGSGEPLADAFRATGEAKALIVYFCRSLSLLFVFLGAMFISNAAFNTLGQPLNSALLNWGRATLGTLPFVTAGKAVAGAKGAIAGNMLGGVVFGVAAIWLAYRMVGQITQSMASPEHASPLN